MQERDLSQSELARMTGLCPSVITMYVHGKSCPRMENVCKILKALDIQMIDLTGEIRKKDVDNPESITANQQKAKLIEEMLLELSLKSGYSQKEISKITGIPYLTLHRYYHGKHVPCGKYIKPLESILEEFGVMTEEYASIWIELDGYNQVRMQLKQLTPHLTQEQRKEILEIVSK
jgi:transcriptional regulator with XRE-family HTH domain